MSLFLDGPNGNLTDGSSHTKSRYIDNEVFKALKEY